MQCLSFSSLFVHFFPANAMEKKERKIHEYRTREGGERYKGWLMESSPSRGRLLSSFEESGKGGGGHDEM